MLFTRYLPITSLIIGSSALLFQITVLYPWHNELDMEFKKLKDLKDAQDKKFDDYNARKLNMISALEAKVDALILIHEEQIKKANIVWLWINLWILSVGI